MAVVCGIDEFEKTVGRQATDDDEPLLRQTLEQQEAYSRGMADAFRHVLGMIEKDGCCRACGHTLPGHLPETIRNGGYPGT